MAMSLRGLCKLNVGLTSSIFCRTNFLNVGVRFLYTEKSLGVTNYEQVRYNFRNQFMTIEDTFRNKMLEVCDNEDGIVFTEDMKAMMHLAQKNENDLNLVRKMVEKFLACEQHMKFGVYVFGPVLMRMYYYLNEPHAALSMYTNPNLSEFFNQRITLLILMSLLFKFEMYTEMNNICSKMMDVPGKENLLKVSFVLVMASCYKLNTAESLEFALTCWNKVSKDNYRPSCRSATLLAALAINQNCSESALEILSTVQRQHFVDVRCLKILAYMHLKKYLQMVPLFKNSLEFDGPPNKQTYFADVVYAVEESVKYTDIPEREELLYLIDNIKKREYITSHMTLDEHLLQPLINNTIHQQRAPQEPTSRGFGRPVREGLRNFL